MPIEFSCPHCQKLLSTSEDKAGRSAKCPGCGERVTVPQPAPPTSNPSLEDDWEVPAEEPRRSIPRESTRTPTATVRSEDDDQERQPCPMCGELIRAAAVKCRYCGELLDGALDQDESPTGEITAGMVFDNAWRVFQKNWGLLIGSWVLSTFIQFVFYFGMILLVGLLAQGQPPGQDPPAAVFLIIAPGLLLFMLLAMFLNLGLLRLNLNVAQGQSAGVADLFSGGSYLLPALGAAMVFMPIYMLGFALCILPGIFAMMALWPMAFLVVDRRLGPIAALQQAWEITRPNLGTIFLMGLIMFGLQMLGVLTCYVGFIITVPLIFLMFTVGYLMMSRQRVARD